MKEKIIKISDKINFKYVFVLVPLIIIALLFIVSGVSGILEERKEKQIEKNIKDIAYKTKDEKVSFTIRETFENLEKGDYDLYVKDKDRQLITGVFTYNLNDYNENTSEGILNNQIEYFKKTRNDMKIYKEKETKKFEDKNVITVEYTGSTADSSKCVYIFSTIQFKDHNDYVVYVNQVVFESDYEKYSKELYKIIKSAKLEQ